jgi:1-acyl-sn-glycerol-3-phosphate acyltransferase
MLPFKKGAFHLAVQGQIPLVPIVFSTYAPEEDLGNDVASRQADKLAGKGRVVYSSKLRRFEGGLIKVKVLPPIETAGLTAENIPGLINETRRRMIETLREISTSGVKTSFPSSDLDGMRASDTGGVIADDYKDLPTGSGGSSEEDVDEESDDGNTSGGLRRRRV